MQQTIEMQGILGDPQILGVPENTKIELYQILSNAGLVMGSEYIAKTIRSYAAIFDDLLVSTPLIKAAFEAECCLKDTTRYHKEGHLTHCCGVAQLAKHCAKTIYSNPLFVFLKEYISEADFTELSELVGLLHDIGKALSRVEMERSGGKKITLYTGHGQIGAGILHELGQNLSSNVGRIFADYKDVILWVINNHMCSCTHMGTADNLERIKANLFLGLGGNPRPNLVFTLLSVLSYADQMGRLSDVQHKSIDVEHHSLELFIRLKDSYKNYLEQNQQPSTLKGDPFTKILVLEQLGLSGSGKSWQAKRMKESLPDYDVVIISRDDSLFKTYAEKVGPTDGLTYKHIYDIIYANPEWKQCVQKQWAQDLADALTTHYSKPTVLIIDSVQMLYPDAWLNTLTELERLSEEASAIWSNAFKLGYYAIPVHMLGYDVESKIGKISMLPPGNSNRGLSWPKVFTEQDVLKVSKDKDKDNILQIDYGTGSISELYIVVKKYFEIMKKKSEEIMQKLDNPQQNICELLNNISKEYGLNDPVQICEKMIDLYLVRSGGNIRFIKYNVEVETDHPIYGKILLYRFTYQDGMQTFNGTTRDYRGEAVLYIANTNEFKYLRPSMPVFPEMSGIHQDPNAWKYLLQIWDKIPAFASSSFLELKSQIQQKEIKSISLVPKYDGSLFCATIHAKSNEMYIYLKALIDSQKENLPPNSYYEVDDLIILIGSKGTVFAKNPVNQRIHNAICGSYGSVDEFLQICHKYVHRPDLFDLEHQIITLHFEAIDAIPTPELTVYYGRAWCPLFGLTTYDSRTCQKDFKLPINEYLDPSFKSLAKVYECNNWNDVYDLYDQLHKDLLDGDDTVEPEGFVITIIGIDGELIRIKFKYIEFYAGHKPNSKHNLIMAQELASNPKYSILKERLAKFKEKPSVRTLVENCVDDLSTIMRFYQDRSFYEQFGSDQSKPIVKGIWAKYWTCWQKNLVASSDFVDAFQNLYLTIAEHYPKYISPTDMRRSIFTFNMTLYNEMNLSQNQLQLCELSTDGMIKLLMDILFS